MSNANKDFYSSQNHKGYSGELVLHQLIVVKVVYDLVLQVLF